MTSNRQISKSLIRKNFSNLESPKKPEWIKVTSFSKNLNLTASIVNDQRLTTVCEEALCPNISECWNKKHATFMILGEVCTRSCSFCNIQTGKPTDVDPFEPLRVAKAVRSCVPFGKGNSNRFASPASPGVWLMCAELMLAKLTMLLLARLNSFPGPDIIEYKLDGKSPIFHIRFSKLA